MHLLFIRYMRLNNPFITDWKAIRRRKQQKIIKNNQSENKNRKRRIYKVHEKVVVREKSGQK